MNKKSRGDMLVPLIFIIVAFAVLLASGAMLNKSATNATEQYSMGENTVDPQQQNLQLQTLKPKRFIPPTLDCGNGQIEGISEPYILWAIDPAPGNIVQKDGKIKVFYQDEWPVTLGQGSITLPKNNQDHAVDPSVGDESAKDSNGFPFFPAIYITDITTDPGDISGDVQKGGTPHKPNEIFGAWQPLGANNANGLPPNSLDLGPDADPFPKESNVKFNGIPSRYEPEYGAEMVWDVTSLGLTDGHIYRAQIILHDGDRGEGDVSEACTTIQY